MRYALLITAIGNPRARKIVAHNIAGHRSISLAYAESLLDKHTHIYMTDLTLEGAQASLKQFTAIGVQAAMRPVDEKNEAPPEPAKEQPVEKAAPRTASEPPELKPTLVKEKPIAQTPPAKSFKHATVRFDPELPEIDPKARLTAIVVLLIAVAGIAFFLYIGQRWQSHGKSPVLSSSGPGAIRKDPKNGSRAPSGRSAAKNRLVISAQDIVRSKHYTDSGKGVTDRNGAIVFYKLAIGVNKYNLDAWFGLLNAYTALGMDDEAAAARQEMERLFGNDIFSISKTVERFGEIIDEYTTTDGACYLEYRSRALENERLFHETFLIAKAIGTQGECPALSFYAHAGKGRGGVLAYISSIPVPDSYQEYRTLAKVTFFNAE
jgi:hypothetical protein